jgi:hypothetical protein
MKNKVILNEFKPFNPISDEISGIPTYLDEAAVPEEKLVKLNAPAIMPLYLK